MRKRWIIPIVGLILTAIFTYLALTWQSDFVLFNNFIPAIRFSNLMSDFAGWSISLVISVTIIMTIYTKLRG